MKKLYKSEKYKAFNKKRSLKGIKDHEKDRGGSISSTAAIRLLEKEWLEAPTIFSIRENTEETLIFFEKFYKVAHSYHKVYVNVRDVKIISPETILYLLLLLDICKHNPKIKITGNAPDDEKCKDIFMNSGFYDYVNSPYRTDSRVNILSVRSRNYVDSEIAAEVIDFASSKLGLGPSVITRAFYTTILECMGNTKEHAYKSREAKYAKWWLIALYDKANSKIKFTILDNGVGIPETVRKRWKEKVFGVQDSKILKSVMEGEFRTSTQKSNRGKGLPKIMYFKNNNLIQDLTIIANNGYFDVDNSICTDINIKFSGTMICWSFIRGDSNE